MTLEAVWDRLISIHDLTFNAHSALNNWTGSGVGKVVVEQPTIDVLLYTESGNWSPSGGKQLSFTNVYRWRLLPRTIRLEHLRFGPDNPVYLFDLGLVADSRMASIEPHV